MSRILAALAVAAVTFSAPLPVLAQQGSVGSICKDGTKDTHVGRGACSRHGGVDKDATANAMKAAADSVKTAKMAAAKTARSNAKTAMNNAKTTASNAANNAKTSVSTSAAASAASAATSSGGSVNNDATGATAKCKDGSYSHAKTHQGACSRHGGVAQWLKS